MNKRLLTSSLWISCTAAAVRPQNNDLGLTLGRIEGADRVSTLWLHNPVAVQLEVHFLANALREVDSFRHKGLCHTVRHAWSSSRVKLLPEKRLSPWFSQGAGHALYEHSTTRLDGMPNPAVAASISASGSGSGFAASSAISTPATRL